MTVKGSGVDFGFELLHDRKRPISPMPSSPLYGSSWRVSPLSALPRSGLGVRCTRDAAATKKGPFWRPCRADGDPRLSTRQKPRPSVRRLRQVRGARGKVRNADLRRSVRPPRSFRAIRLETPLRAGDGLRAGRRASVGLGGQG